MAIIVATIASLLSPWAEISLGKANKSMTPVEQAQSYSYLYALRNCIANNGTVIGSNSSGASLSTERAKNISAGNWFNAPVQPIQAASFLIPGVNTEGMTTCNIIVRSASTLWGYGNPKDLYCSFIKDSICTSQLSAGSNNDLVITQQRSVSVGQGQAMIQAVAAKVYEGKIPNNSSGTLDAKHLYLYYYHAFTTGCGAGENPNASGDTAYTVTLAKNDGTTEQKKYSGAKHGDKKSVYTDSSGPVQKTCNEIAAQVTKYAPSFAAYAKANPKETPAAPKPKEEETKPETSCIVDGIGWLVCPVTLGAAKMADAAYAFLANNFLELDVNILNTQRGKQVGDTTIGTGTYDAWRAMQTIANVAFVIAFLVIIYSQLTSTGIGNYGVKRLLPRIVIAAILVNSSFLICQIAVDISNILGYGLKNMFGAIDIGTAQQAGTNTLNKGFNLGSLTSDILTGTLVIGAVGVGVWLGLPLIGGAILATLVALISVGFILVARKALVILFVAISPLAFVAYLLPNTEQYFKKWYDLFLKLLLLFPVVGVLFGAGTLASQILINVAGIDPILKITGLAAAAIPLFAVIPVMKGALNGIGNIGAKINGISSRAEGSARARGRKAWDNSRFGRARTFNAQKRAKTIGQIRDGHYNGPSTVGRFASGLSRGFNNKVMGSYGQELDKQATQLAIEEQEQGVKDSMSLLQNGGLTATDIHKIAMGQSVGKFDASDETTRLAAIRTAMSQNNIAANEQLIEASGGMSSALRKEVANGVTSNNLANKAAYLGGDMVDKIAQGQINSQADLDVAAGNSINSGKFSAETLAKQDPVALQRISKVMNKAENGTYKVADEANSVSKFIKLDREQLTALQDQAYSIRQGPGNLKESISSAQAQHIDNIEMSSANNPPKQ